MPSIRASPLPATDQAAVLDRVCMAYGRRRVFDSLSCGFPQGRISVILGTSGSGKSSILRLIGGLARPVSGTVRVQGEDVAHLTRRGLRNVRRKLGMMFQGGALLDSYSVFDNVALPLRERRRMTPSAVAAEVRATLNAVGVDHAESLLPGELSGGMLRRVALARAIISKPVILLCDEPFSGLDPVTIKRMEALLSQINRQLGMTMIIVSHDIPSTLRLADHVLLLSGGSDGRPIEGTPAQMRRSAEPGVAEFFNDALECPELQEKD